MVQGDPFAGSCQLVAQLSQLHVVESVLRELAMESSLLQLSVASMLLQLAAHCQRTMRSRRRMKTMRMTIPYWP